MRNLKTSALCSWLLAAVAVAVLAQERSLYDRLGGEPAVTKVISDFASVVLKDERINKKFARSDTNRLVANFKAFVCAATGGPCKYEGLSMPQSHKKMGVTEGEFNALVEDLVKALDMNSVPTKEKNELLATLAPLKPQIVEVNTQAMGAELPDKFKPAPPLGSEKDRKLKKKMAKDAEKIERKAKKDKSN